MSLEIYRNIASDSAFRASQAAQMAAAAADRAYTLGPDSIAAELCAHEACVASLCAEAAHKAAQRTRETEIVEDAKKWADLAHYMADKAMAAAEEACRIAADHSLYD